LRNHRGTTRAPLVIAVLPWLPSYRHEHREQTYVPRLQQMALTDERSVKMRQDRAKARAAAKALLKAGQAADDGEFLYQLHQLRNTMNGWTLAMRQIARLGHVSKEIQSAFALTWTSDRHLPCAHPHAFLDGLRVLFPPYHGPAMHLFRGAPADEARKRKLYGISWTSDVETADWFAKQYEDSSIGGVVLETIAPVPSENSIRLDSQPEPESSHHPGRCLRSSTCSGSSLSTFSSRDAGWKPRICFSVNCGERRLGCGCTAVIGRCWYG
jgi:hypothetical protein